MKQETKTITIQYTGLTKEQLMSNIECFLDEWDEDKKFPLLQRHFDSDTNKIGRESIIWWDTSGVNGYDKFNA